MGKINYGVLKVLKNHKINDTYGVLTLKGKGLYPKPGQFFMIDCMTQEMKRKSFESGNKVQSFLQRPFSVFLKNRGGSFDILYKVNQEGRGTGYLMDLKEGDEIFFKGPLGSPIKISKICEKDKVVNLIAGGVGVAPLTFLAQELMKQRYKIRVFFGVRELDSFLEYCLKVLQSLGLNCEDIFVSSESLMEYFLSLNFNESFEDRKLNSYRGFSLYKGNFIQAYEAYWKNLEVGIKGINFICAPESVMKYFHKELVLNQNQKLYAFFEEYLGCGFGVCCSCNKNGHLICSEGPCFDSKVIFN